MITARAGEASAKDGMVQQVDGVVPVNIPRPTLLGNAVAVAVAGYREHVRRTGARS